MSLPILLLLFFFIFMAPWHLTSWSLGRLRHGESVVNGFTQTSPARLVPWIDNWALLGVCPLQEHGISKLGALPIPRVEDPKSHGSMEVSKKAFFYIASNQWLSII